MTPHAFCRLIGSLLGAVVLSNCNSSTDAPAGKMRPQSVVLLVTPKMIPDFDRPQVAVARFFEHYKPMTTGAAETVVIFAVGNSDHILDYRGVEYWNDNIEWARTTDFIPISEATLDYHQLDGIVRAFRDAAEAAGVNVKVFDHIDSGSEFTLTNRFKYVRHPECTSNEWGMFDVRARLQADETLYASAPGGIAEGTLCGEFLADQVSRYIHDVGFDGILFDNQLGTRGRWHDGDGPGYSDEEAAGIQEFLEYSQKVLAGKSLMWFDSYNNVQVERETFSFPADGYSYFDYLIASGFCVTIKTRPYTDNLSSKLQIRSRPRILATLDYVDPWYSYSSMTDFAGCSAQLEQTAIDYRYEIDGIMLFASDRTGALVPRKLVESFAARFFGR
ncbi:MAG: hypothetical protein ABI681_04075 [Gemmatimonadales bacterium]